MGGLPILRPSTARMESRHLFEGNILLFLTGETDGVEARIPRQVKGRKYLINPAFNRSGVNYRLAADAEKARYLLDVARPLADAYGLTVESQRELIFFQYVDTLRRRRSLCLGVPPKTL